MNHGPERRGRRVLDLSPYFACPQTPFSFDFRFFVEHHDCEVEEYSPGLDAATSMTLDLFDGQWVFRADQCPVSERELPIEFGSYVPHPQPSRYDVSNPSAVADVATGLVWEHHLNGSSYYGTQYDALTYCEDLSWAGFTDWRLPTAYELMTLMKTDEAGSYLDEVAFPNDHIGVAWSASAYAPDPSLALLVAKYPTSSNVQWDALSTIVADVPDYAYDVRCVRGGTTPPTRYTDLGNGTVRDNRSGVVWEKSPAQSSLTPRAAQAYCRNLALAGGGWRVPTIKSWVSPTMPPAIQRWSRSSKQRPPIRRACNGRLPSSRN